MKVSPDLYRWLSVNLASARLDHFSIKPIFVVRQAFERFESPCDILFTVIQEIELNLCINTL